MIVLISSEEEMMPQELEVLQGVELTKESVRFHLRKPTWSKTKLTNWVEAVRNDMPNLDIVVHEHQVDRCQLHLPERLRIKANEQVVSTSFHSMKQAVKEGHQFDYFFCSPVFSSISKSGYHPSESWNIREWAPEIRQKAVALGGITSTRLDQVRKRGFEHIAVCGAIWTSAKPEQALKKIIDAWQDNDHSV